MDRRTEKADQGVRQFVGREVGWWTWRRVLVAAIVILLILEIGTYAFNWSWTGFKNNDTVWDWLSLLLLPIALAAVPIWFAAEEKQQRIWLEQLRVVAVIAVAILLVLFVGTFAFGWSWTGFKDHGRVWDWLSLLLVPVLVAILPIWITIRQSKRSDDANRRQY